MDSRTSPDVFSDRLRSVKNILLPPYISDLARVELLIHTISSRPAAFPPDVKVVSINPSLSLIPVSYKNLVSIIEAQTVDAEGMVLEADGVHVMTWHDPKTGEVRYREADDSDLLALKIVIENIEPKAAAIAGGVTIGTIEAVLRRAISQRILLSPSSLIRRSTLSPLAKAPEFQEFISTDIFTLQWHITQACDLQCKHCYDRSDLSPLPYEEALSVVDDFYEFCQLMNVSGQVTFTGGNPLLYPHFMDIYRETSERGFGIAILGNPAPRHQIEKLLTIEKPLFFQISLEGVETQNDKIRGDGHFRRSLEFLDQLRELGIYSMVMLTLTRDNLDQVLPLGDLLKDRADSFTFNRLSTVGEGASLLMAKPEDFENFLMKYEEQSRKNPILGLKDNLLNIIRNQQGIDLFGGCTGYGCGAAFNFVSLLADGEVHACRKFPSPIGNIKRNRLVDIYRSEPARKYREGSSACQECRLNLVCRGCLAIAHSCGLDVFRDKDPFCFLTDDSISDQT